jgi:MFS family permease
MSTSTPKDSLPTAAGLETGHTSPLQPAATLTATDSGADIDRHQPPRVSFVWLLLFALSFAGVYIIVLSPITVTLALRVSALVPAAEAGGALGLIVSIGAFGALIAQPLFGRLSDGTTSRMGMRRPWILLGLVGSAVGTTIMAIAPNLTLLGIGFLIVQILVNAAGASLYGVLADQVPASQRGVASGIIGTSIPISLPLGAFLVQLVSPNAFLMFMLPLAAGAIPIIIFAFYLKDRRLAPEDKRPFSFGEFFGAFWVNPVRFRDFGLVWWGRFFFILAYAYLTTYQAFFLISELGADAIDVPGLILTSTLVLSGLTLVSSLLGGKLSDMMRRRKVFVVAAAIVYGIGLIVITQAHDFNLFLIGMGIAGFGFGAYAAVDTALLVDVLPSRATAAKDLAVGSIASTLPQSLAPATAPLILAMSSNSYSVLYLVAAACAIFSAVFILPVKQAR